MGRLGIRLWKRSRCPSGLKGELCLRKGNKKAGVGVFDLGGDWGTPRTGFFAET